MADAVLAKNTPTFAPVPEGDYQAVCVDVIDLGMHENKTYGVMQHKVALVFQCLDEGGKRHEVAERFTVSMSDKARLRMFLEQWRGRPYKADQLDQGVPLDKLEGTNGNVVIVHNKSGEKTYANVFSIRPLSKADVPIKAEKYARAPYWAEVIAKGRVSLRQRADDSEEDGEPPHDEDDLPF